MDSKKSIRARFRKSVFERDRYTCRVCSVKGTDRQESDDNPTLKLVYLDAHHITDRSLMPNGGYVKENGISLCEQCHIKAEEFWHGVDGLEGFAPEDLYKLIGSNEEIAVSASIDLIERVA